MTVDVDTPVDQDALFELIGRFVGDLGATMAAGNIVIGHRLGLYSALADTPAAPEQLATRTGTNQRYVTEWLAGQAAGGVRDRGRSATRGAAHHRGIPHRRWLRLA